MQHKEEEGKKKANSVAETESMKAVMKKRNALQQIQRDLEIINAGVAMAEKIVLNIKKKSLVEGNGTDNKKKNN